MVNNAELLLQELDKLMNELETEVPRQLENAKNLQKLLRMGLQECKSLFQNPSAMNPNYYTNGSGANDDIPESLLHLPAIKAKTKRLILKESRVRGVTATSEKFLVSGDLIRKWVNESAVKGEAPDFDYCEGRVLNTYTPNNKRSAPDTCANTESDSLIFNSVVKNSLNDFMQDKDDSYVLGNDDPVVQGKRPNEIDKMLSEITNKPLFELGQTCSAGSNTGRRYHRSKIFCTLEQGEKERVLFDYLAFGKGKCVRKYGIERSALCKIIKTQGVDEQEGKERWMREQSEILKNKYKLLNRENSQKGIEAALEKYIGGDPPQPKLTIPELCDLAYERGIAVASTTYSINLFELEFLMQDMYPERWTEMERRSWYLTGDEEFKRNCITLATKLEAIHVAKTDGLQHASKKVRIKISTIRKYLNMYEAYGPEALEDVKKSKRVIRQQQMLEATE